jgi:phosphoglycerol transferase MdoB-like AlkP superfamily enzyme
MEGLGDDRRRAALVASVWAVWFAVAMEWLFTATMPSFMDSLTAVERARILLVAPLLLAVPTLALTWLLGWIVPAVVCACAALLMIDNFTYTVFRFGIASTQGAWRAAYGILVVALIAAFYRRLRRSAHRFRHPTLGRATVGLLVAAAGVAAWRSAQTTPELDLGRGAVARRRPNVLILSTDGLDAAHMSAYGYRRDTTPFIRTLVPRALIAENAFPNGTITVASLVSLLTGKSPIRTRVYSTKDALLGAEAYQSLPAILRRTGYSTIALVPGVVDPYGQNLRDAFDMANSRPLQGAVPFPSLPDGIAVALAPEVYFC